MTVQTLAIDSKCLTLQFPGLNVEGFLTFLTSENCLLLHLARGDETIPDLLCFLKGILVSFCNPIKRRTESHLRMYYFVEYTKSIANRVQ